MRKIKKILKYVTLEVPKNKYELFKEIKNIIKNIDDAYLYFYKIKNTNFISDIPKFILELDNLYELYVDNNTIPIWKHIVHYTYKRKQFGYNRLYSIYSDNMSIDDILIEIAKICYIALDTNNTCYNIYYNGRMYSTWSAINAIDILIDIYESFNRNRRTYDYNLFMDMIARYDHSALYKYLKNKFEGKMEHPS